MEYRKLGATDLSVSRIGFGCWAIGGHGYGVVDDQESAKAIHEALDSGINLFDTADVYGFGYSEEILGNALGSEKSKVIIATKFGVVWDQSGRTFKDCSPNRIKEALESSLRRLKVDCIPLYQIHWYDGVTPIAEIMETLKRYRKEGKIRHIGACNIPLSLLREASKFERVESAQIQYNVDEMFENGLVETATDLRLGVIAYNVLARGLFSGKYNEDSSFGVKDTRGREKAFIGEELKNKLKLVKVLREIGKNHSKSSTQVAIRWVLDNPNIASALIGVKTHRQLVENLGALDWNLQPEDREYLNTFRESNSGSGKAE